MAFKANHQLVRLCRKSVFSDNIVCDLDFRIHDAENVTMSSDVVRNVTGFFKTHSCILV